MKSKGLAKRSRRIVGVLVALAAFMSAAQTCAQEADPILEAAEAYAAFRADTSSLGQAQITALDELDRALDLAARHNRDALSRGWIAYGAMAAAHSPAFAAGIASVTQRYGRTAVLRALTQDPSYPSRRRGYGEAIAYILAAAAADAQSTRAAADRFEAAVWRPHHWPDTGSAADRAERLRRLGAASFVSRVETRDGVVGFTFVAPERPLRLAPAHVATARRMASLAAMRILNARGDWRVHMRRILDDEPTRACIQLEQLQFYQCVAVTHDVEEAASCMSRHAVGGVGDCLGSLVEAN